MVVSSITMKGQYHDDLAWSPEDPSELQEARKQYNRRDYGNALDAYNRFLQRGDTKVQRSVALYESARALFALQHYDEAIERSLEVALNYASTREACKALMLAGQTQFGLGRFRDADLSFLRLEQEPSSCPEALEARLLRVDAAYDSGDLRAALQRFRELDENTLQECRAKEVCETLVLLHNRNPGPAAEAPDWIWLSNECPQLKITKPCHDVNVK